jgi:hypothetical protein
MTREERIQLMLDKQEIQECIVSFSRGLDRHDVDLARSAFHGDARDDHGIFIGSGYETIDWANAWHDFLLRSHQHYVTNFTIEVDGDEAHSESYVMVPGGKKDSWENNNGGGRYLDRLERRDGRWAITDRVVTFEWWGGGAPAEGEELDVVSEITFPFSQDRSDVSYTRPLRVTREPRDMSKMP